LNARGREGRKGKGPHDEVKAKGLTVPHASASADIKAWAAIVDWSDDDEWDILEAEEAEALEDRGRRWKKELSKRW